MKKATKQVMGIALSLALTTTILAGCGKKDENQKAELDMDTSQPVTIDMMLLNNTSGDGSEFIIKQELKEKFNADISFSLNNNQSHFEKLNLLIASNELPDIVSPLPAEKTKLIGPKGALVPIDEYFDYLPNLKKYLDKDKVNMVSAMADDGHIYALPRFAPDKKDYKWTPIIRQDYLDELNIPVPTTYDELFDALRKIKTAHPETVGIVNREKMDFLRAFGVGYNTAPEMFYNKETDKFEYGPTNTGFKELITDFAQAWKDGILDKEFFTASEQQWQEKFLGGNGVFTLDWPKRAYNLKDSYGKLHPGDTKFNTTLIEPLVSDNYKTKRLNYSETLGLWTSWAISSNTKNLGRILQIVDWMYSDEAQEMVQWGIKDETFTLTEDGKHQYTSNLKASYNPDGQVDPMNTLGLNHNRIMRVEKDNGVTEVPVDLKAIIDGYQDTVEGYETDYKIALTFTEQQSDRIEEIKMITDTLVNESVVAFVTGTKPIDQFDQFVSEIRAQGGEELEKIYAEAYASYQEKMNAVQ